LVIGVSRADFFRDESVVGGFFRLISLNPTFAWRGFAALIGCSDDQASGSRMTDLVEVGRFKTLADARQQVLVLAAVGIECHLMRADRDVRLYVASTDVKQAVQELACYERENLPSGQRPLPARPPRHAVDAALAYCAALLFFFGAERRHALSVDWAAVGAAQAGLIRDGAWWRTFTVYLAAILDAWSRRVVGYAISRSVDARLTLAALKAALRTRRPPSGCVHHSDSECVQAGSAWRSDLRLK
jgi:transposase InsO family protein